MSLASTDTVTNSTELVDFSPPQQLKLSGGHETAVLACAYANSGSTVVSGGLDPYLCLWDLTTGSNYVIDNPGRNAAATTTLQVLDKTCATGSADAHLTLVDLETGITLRRYTGHTRAVNQVQRVNSQQQLASVSDDGSVNLWDLASKKPVWSVATPFPLFSLATTDDHLVYATGLEPIIRVYDTRNSSGTELFSWSTEHSDSICSIDIAPNGKLCSLGFDNQVHFYDAPIHSSRDSRLLGCLTASEDNANEEKYLVRCKFINNDRYVITQGSVYDVTSRLKVLDYQGSLHQQIIDMDYDAPSNTIVMGSSDGSLQVSQL